jgi:hypothetical protein
MGMFLDFIILWSVALLVLKMGLKGYITPEAGAVVLFGAAGFLAVARMIGSKIFLDKSRVPKLLISLSFFCLSVADGDVEVAIQAAILTAALPIAAFGLYIMFRAPGR